MKERGESECIVNEGGEDWDTNSMNKMIAPARQQQ